MIIDTDVLIWELRGNLKAREIVHLNIPFSISVVTYIELLQGMRSKKELQVFIKQFSEWGISILQINNNISSRAMMYIENYGLSHTMQLADALIAATAISFSDILLTANEKHYRHIPNIQIKKFTPH